MHLILSILYRYSSVNGQKASAFKQKPFVRLFFFCFIIYDKRRNHYITFRGFFLTLHHICLFLWFMRSWHQLPISVRHKKRSIKKRPGIKIIHHARITKAFWASASILPHEIVSIGRPSPRKLSVDSSAIAVRTLIIIINKMDGRKFGARCQ